jgi:hypothetical protein
MNDIALVFLIICLIQFLLIILIYKPQKLKPPKFLSQSNTKLLQIFLVISMLFLYSSLFIQIEKYQKPHPLEAVPYTFTKVYPTAGSNIVQMVGIQKKSPITNLYFIYLSEDKSKQTLASIAWGLRQSNCKALCIINIFDNKSAYDRAMTKDALTSNTDIKEWNKKNYVFVADHFLGYLDAVQDASFAYYPLHDGYYRHAKAGTLDAY